MSNNHAMNFVKTDMGIPQKKKLIYKNKHNSINYFNEVT